MNRKLGLGTPQDNCLIIAFVLFALPLFGQTPAPVAPVQSDPKQNSASDELPQAPSAITNTTGAANEPTCIEPEPAFDGLEYNGPFKKLVVHIAGKPEIKTIHHPHDHSGKPVCSLPVKKKFTLFAKDTFEPVTFIIAGFNAGVAQASNDDPTFGQGAEGFGRRYGAAFADQVSGEFFGTFLYPSLFHEDPRYYRLGHGTVPKRFFHAVEHSFVTHSDSGAHWFNFSEWSAAASTSALGNLYHPGNKRGFQPTARGAAWSVAFDMGFDVAREFWPELTQRLKLPFVVHTHPAK